MCEFFLTLWCFHSNQKKFLDLKLNNLFGVFARVWNIKEKGFWEKEFDSTSISWFQFFPRIFFVILISIPLVFSTLELHLLSYSIGFLCGRKRLFVVVV